MRWPWRKHEPVFIQVPGITTAPAAIGRASYPVTPDRLLAADLGSARTDSGMLYVAAVLDCYSRRCLGWSTSERLAPELVIRAVRLAAVCRCRPSTGSSGQTRVGGEVALALAPRCAAAGIAVPPGASPSAIDGAVPDSFLSMLRSELVGTPAWRTRTDAAQAIAGWIAGTYNRDRVAFVPGVAA
jgi:putative transposase